MQEPLPWTLTAGDVLIVGFTVIAVLLLSGGLALQAGRSAGILSTLAPALLLLVFSEMFIRRRNNSLAASVYPWLMGGYLVKAALVPLVPLLKVGALPSVSVLTVIGGLVWASTGLFYWQRYRAPSAVSQFVMGLFVATVVSAVAYLLSNTLARPYLSATLFYCAAFAFGATCAWLGRKFDRLDVSRTGECSRIAFWFHSKGAMGMTAGLLIPYFMTVGKMMAGALGFPAGIELLIGLLCTFVGAGAVLLSLRWNRKYYTWAGAVCLVMGVYRLTAWSPLWLAFSVALGMVGLLFSWEQLRDRFYRDA